MYGQTEASPRISYIEYPKKKKKNLEVLESRSLEANFFKKELIYKIKNIFCGYSENDKDLSKIENYKHLSGKIFKKKDFFI